MEIQSYMELDRSQQRGSSTVYFLPATYSYTRHPTIGTQTQSMACLFGRPGKKQNNTTTAGRASTTYRHQPPCRSFTHSPNLKFALTPLQELPLIPQMHSAHPFSHADPKTSFPPRVHPSLSCTTPRNRRTLPSGYLPGRLPLSLAGTSDPVAARSLVRFAVLLAHSPNFHSLQHWGSPGEPDPPLKRSVTHGEGRGRH